MQYGCQFLLREIGRSLYKGADAHGCLDQPGIAQDGQGLAYGIDAEPGSVRQPGLTRQAVAALEVPGLDPGLDPGRELAVVRLHAPTSRELSPVNAHSR